MTELCLRFGAQMVDRGGGAMLNIGSMTAYVGASSLIGYASSKRYVISYSEELCSAFAPHGVRVACLVPGLTETAFFSASGVPLDASAARQLGMLTPEQVADQGYALAFSGPAVEICGAKNQWLARLAPWIPSFVIDRARRQLHGQAPGPLVPAKT